jgi:16S rRNA (cytidine1402-2'-O)-methyltransferase
MLGAGKSVALVAEAGTPGISDPGRRLVDAVRAEGFRIIPVPGASAAVAALSISGMSEPRFVFEGFLPRRSARRQQRLRELADDERQLVFFEAPHRLLKCLRDMKDALGDRQCLIAREITKHHEDIEKGTLSSFIEKYSKTKPRGEFVLICEGGLSPKRRSVTPEILAEARALARQGLKKREVAKMIAAKYSLKAREIYRMISK